MIYMIYTNSNQNIFTLIQTSSIWNHSNYSTVSTLLHERSIILPKRSIILNKISMPFSFELLDHKLVLNIPEIDYESDYHPYNPDYAPAHHSDYAPAHHSDYAAPASYRKLLNFDFFPLK